MFALQVKRDLSIGVLLCSDNTASLLASYIVQGKYNYLYFLNHISNYKFLAEIGDYLESYNNNPSYFNNRKYFPHQTVEHEIRIMNFHKNHL